MSMKAAVVGKAGPELRDLPIPAPGPNEVLVKIHAAALNRADLGMAAGHKHGSSGGVGAPLGLEWAGEVIRAGAEAGGYQPGDRVMCSGLGGFAEYAVADHRRCFTVPDRMGWREAACFPVALRTMVDAVLINGAMQRGQKVMILGASSGVGILGMQIAKACGAALVIGTSTNPQRRGQLTSYGADHAIDPSAEDWAQHVLELSGGSGVDLIVDMLSGPYVNAAMTCTALGGRIVNVGRLAGQLGEFNFDLHALRRIQYIGVTFRTRTIDDVAAINERVRQDVWRYVEDGRFKMPMDRDMPLMQIRQTLAEMHDNNHFGKITVSPGN
ncbi:zinc-binding dehydrogenase [Pseudooceanicola sp.]|uniref:quinone oxidoreductase family protein n=1 Tax=Pseudooceanicola sp. TaxID=1914328 RepID=UPI0026297C32|nr:zinc-binding dehydrogenase [Pseudooceanicola sp.]MDF1857299.1 zinc-binding dehydrogenase [Pseudooceanicola sp.]